MVKRYTPYELAMKFPEGGVRCFDCGEPYGTPEWIEAVVHSDVWEQINPSHDRGGGILCIKCMANRCIEVGLDKVRVMLKAGPLFLD